MIFFCYGMPKSASSFVFQMTASAAQSLEKTSAVKVRRLSELIEGCPVTDYAEVALAEGLRIPRPGALEAEKISNYLGRLYGNLLERMGDDSNEVTVIKTHLPCSPHIAEAISNGTVLASASFRHPAEMLLSRLDMAKRDGVTLKFEALKSIFLKHVDTFYSWANLPRVRKYYYDEIVLRPKAIVEDIYRHLGSTEDHSELTEQYLAQKENNIWQFNKGILNRHLYELSDKEVMEIEHQFADFMEYINEHMGKLNTISEDYRRGAS